MRNFRGRLARRAATAAAWLLAICSWPATAFDYDLMSAGVQGRIGERTVLGKKSPESFIAYDVRASFRTPWEHPFASGWVVGARFLASAGLFEGPDQTAISASAIPLIAIGTADRRFTLDGGIGLGLLSAHRYAEQDFGGPAQFALTVGLEVPLYRRLGLAYRFMHYSDAGAYGPDTIGADLHMAGFSYRF